MRLYDYSASANCLKVRILVAQLGLDVERVPVDIFGGDTLTDDYLTRNPAGETPVLELPSGAHLPESNAILLYLAEGSPFLPDEPEERAQVYRWLFFEQSAVVPSIGSARFWILTGRDAGREVELERRLRGARSVLTLLDGHLAANAYLVGGRYTLADLAVYGYTHVAPDAGIDLGDFPHVQRWLESVEAQPGFVDDLVTYPENARAGVGASIYG
jgi:glutathione S-transferase